MHEHWWTVKTLSVFILCSGSKQILSLNFIFKGKVTILLIFKMQFKDVVLRCWILQDHKVGYREINSICDYFLVLVIILY